jgi:hypothetical protein
MLIVQAAYKENMNLNDCPATNRYILAINPNEFVISRICFDIGAGV